jgi:mannosyltransferase OCH1-like enzyme
VIPRIIHQTSQSKLIALRPGWEYRHWTDRDNVALVKESTPHLLPLYTALRRGVMKADMIRYVFLLLETPSLPLSQDIPSGCAW